MSTIAIKAEDVGKLYRLGQIGTGTISHDLNRWFARIRGKEDPFAKIGETNDRTSKGGSDYVWALKDVSFEIEKGSAVGIIGRNGAGKSTLLKLLSKVTKPSTGKIYIKDRIASLLEVGTGFHPEMTGRENIYLNGAILGMTKREISRKFDEIVDFSGVARYVDTPVKRYSSGMYVRLAFAVAAHLESEILIVDEVLAVGDAEFQRKCLGKMGEVSKGEGRTVLFVSHNMGAVQELCNTGLLMHRGRVEVSGEINTVLDSYVRLGLSSTNNYVTPDDSLKPIQVLNATVEDENGTVKTDFGNGDPVFVRLLIKNTSAEKDVRYNLSISDVLDRVISVDSLYVEPETGYTEYVVELPVKSLTPNRYKVGISIDIPSVRLVEAIGDELSFQLINVDSKVGKRGDTDYGFLMPDFKWSEVDRQS